jgi:hypothetical protein
LDSVITINLDAAFILSREFEKDMICRLKTHVKNNIQVKKHKLIKIEARTTSFILSEKVL